ncbi:MAG: divalent-cation tolerance protein CutA [Magnetococcales bacterium]|nr:divalent-cation tolerance protein CutA [Magnetococcales bacterium]MBF0156021.1 divalent-cation tolerance protein CutA [Magnetococcales bacterium]
MGELMVVLSNAPDAATAESLARLLVEEGLAACVHVLPGGLSFYEWEGSLHREGEWSMVIKTRAELYERLQARLAERHPYEVPEILGITVERALPAYRDWLFGVTAKGRIAG